MCCAAAVLCSELPACRKPRISTQCACSLMPCLRQRVTWFRHPSPTNRHMTTATVAGKLPGRPFLEPPGVSDPSSIHHTVLFSCRAFVQTTRDSVLRSGQFVPTTGVIQTFYLHLLACFRLVARNRAGCFRGGSHSCTQFVPSRTLQQRDGRLCYQPAQEAVER